ncbi:MAG: sugar phosphate isomerase/epimerase [Alphaproteobacteria bacterium]
MSVLDRLSVQLYSAREFPPLEAQLDTLVALGYRKVEPYGGLLDQAETVAPALRSRGLAAPSSHIGLAKLQTDFDGAVRAAQAMAIPLLIVPAVPHDQREKDAAGWLALGRELDAQQKKLRAEGIRLAWHNHAFEFKRTADGRYPMDLILEGAPEIQWQVDVGWLDRAGEPAADWVARYRDRIVAFHVKDVAPAGENADEDGWADIGFGVLDWAALLPVMESASPELLVLEHDKPNDFARFVRRSMETIKRW